MSDQTTQHWQDLFDINMSLWTLSRAKNVELFTEAYMTFRSNQPCHFWEIDDLTPLTFNFKEYSGSVNSDKIGQTDKQKELNEELDNAGCEA